MNLVWCNSIKNQSVSVRVNPWFLIVTKIPSDSIRLYLRLLIQINPKEVLNLNESGVRMIQAKFSIRIIPTSDSLGLKDWSGFIWIPSLGWTRIKPDRFSTDLHQTSWKFFFGLIRMRSEWRGYRFRNKSDWFGKISIRNFYQGLLKNDRPEIEKKKCFSDDRFAVNDIIQMRDLKFIYFAQKTTGRSCGRTMLLGQ